MAVTTHQQRAPRVSEGTRSAQEINRHATRNAMPSPYLLDTRPASAHKAPPTLRSIKPARAAEAAQCGHGTCAVSPACTRACRYREADQALRGHYSQRHTQRAEMPEPSGHEHEATRRFAIAVIAWATICLSVATWAFVS